MRLSIKVRFRILLAACAAAAAVVAAGLLVTERARDRAFRSLSEETVPALLEAEGLRAGFERLVVTTDAILIGRDSARLDERARLVRDLAAEIRSAATRPGASPRLSAALVELGVYERATYALILRRLGEPLPPSLRDTWGGTEPGTLAARGEDHRVRAVHHLDELVREREDVLAERLASTREASERRATAVAAAALLALGLLFVSLLAQGRAITGPLDGLVRAARRAAEGRLDQTFELPAARDDELGDLVRTFERIRSGLQDSTVSRQQVDRILAAMPELVVVCDPDVRIRTLNPAAHALLGYSAEETSGRLLVEYVTPAYRSTFRACVRSLRHDDVLDDAEIELQRVNGEGVLVRLAAATLRNATGGFDGFVFSGADFTQWKRIEEELLQAKIAAEDGTRAKSAFLATMSHEIRTPMTAVLGYAENLMDPDLDEAARVEAARTIYANGQHLVELINSILDLSKIEAGRLDIERVDTDPVQVMAEACDLLRGPAVAKGLSLEVGYTGELPERIRTDPTRLRQILVNLIGNAIKFTDVGGIRVQATLDRSEHLSEPQLNVLVIDSGIGMSAEALGRVFSPFTQADDSMSRRFGGTGLGLAISRHLSQLLGGDIVVYSEPGNGSTFRVTIATGSLDGVPFRTPQKGVQAASKAARAVPRPAECPKLTASILVVEDTEVNLRLIEHILTRAGATVESATDGQVGVAAVKRAAAAGTPFEAVLMDVQMPVMDGLTATRVLRRCGFALPIVALTANASLSDRDACLAAGCSDFATKPIQRQQLLETLARLVREHRARAVRADEAAADEAAVGRDG